MKTVLPLLFLLHTSISIWAQTGFRDTLIIGYRETPPFVTKMENGLAGPSVWLWEQMADELEIPYTYRELTLDSLLLGIGSGQIHVGLSPLSITSARYKKMDFTAPYHIAHSAFLQREESAWAKAMSFLNSFFSVNFVRALGALVVVILIFGVLIWYFERRKNPEEFHSGWKGLWEGFWWSAVTMTTVGYGDKSPRTVGGRIVGLIWMFTAIIIISGFTASIASSLTMNQMGSSNSALGDFKKMPIGTLSHSATDQWLRDNFYTQKAEYENLDQLLHALNMERIDAAAYDRPVLKAIAMQDSSKAYSLADVKYNPQFYAFGLSRKLQDTLKEQLNVSMLNKIERMEWRVLLSENDLD
ncbi:MAG: transporter substrate-binding domain-containing protein [Bacteroidota bacterium]